MCLTEWRGGANLTRLVYLSPPTDMERLACRGNLGRTRNSYFLIARSRRRRESLNPNFWWSMFSLLFLFPSQQLIQCVAERIGLLVLLLGRLPGLLALFLLAAQQST